MTEDIFTCADCENETPLNEEQLNDREQSICQSCREDYYSCEECSEIFHSDDTYEDNHGGVICERCYRQNYYRCGDCEEVFHNDDLNEDEICSDCQNDRDENNGEENEEKYEIIIPFRKVNSESFKKNKFKNLIGVEIETLNNNLDMNSFDYDSLVKYGFSQVFDGSLGFNGIEFVSNAFNGDCAFNRIKTLCKELKKRNFYINKSCGLHLHIKIPKRTDYIKKIALFYSKYEDFIFEMLPKSRGHNSFCYKFKECYPNLERDISKINTSLEFQKYFYQTKTKREIDNRKKKKYDSARYNWLNFHSIFYRGTLEIRNHSGTLNDYKINNWVKIHLTILEFLKNLNLETIKELPNTKEFFLSLFDEKIKKYILSRMETFTELNQEENN